MKSYKLNENWSEFEKELFTRLEQHGKPRGFLTCAEVADHYGVTTRTVWAWIGDERITAIKAGRKYLIRRDDMEAFETANLTRER